jgi:Leucine-rich repeat (LRR) protein
VKGFQIKLDAAETENLYDVLSRIEREQYFTWILEKSHTRSEQGKLVALDISWLGIRYLPTNFLQGLDHLHDLRFDNNPRCHFEDESFNLRSLNNLKLQYCQLDEFPAHTITENNKLEYLELSYNPIYRAGSDNYVHLNQLIELELHHCQIHELDPLAFQGLDQLKLLNLNFNNLSKLPPNAFQDLRNLQLLTIEGNQLQNLDSTSFSGLKNLEELMLPYNQLQQLPNNIFRDLKSVKTISLIHNQLLSIDRQFANLPSLTSLNLQMNLIQSIPPNAFHGSNNLIHFSLESNQVEELDMRIFESLHQLEFFNINNNPLSVESSLQLPQFSKFDYTPLILQLSPEALHELVTKYSQNDNFVKQALHSGKLLQKTRAFIRLLGYTD